MADNAGKEELPSSFSFVGGVVTELSNAKRRELTADGGNVCVLCGLEKELTHQRTSGGRSSYICEDCAQKYIENARKIKVDAAQIEKEIEEEFGEELEGLDDPDTHGPGEAGHPKTMGDKIIGSEGKKENGANEDRERMFAILELLGFTRYDEKFGTRYKFKQGDLMMARDFNEKNPNGRFWVKKGDNFLKDDECKEVEQIKKFYDLRDSDRPVPPLIVVGEVIGKSESGKGILVAFTETADGERKEQWYGKGAVKTNRQGKDFVDGIGDGERFIPAGFSKASGEKKAKMEFPRCMVLDDYETRVEKASVVQHGGNGNGKEEEQAKLDKEAEKEAHPEGKKIPAGTSVLERVPEDDREEIVQKMAYYTRAAQTEILPIYDEFMINGAGLLSLMTAAEIAEIIQKIAVSMSIDDGKNRRTPRY